MKITTAEHDPRAAEKLREFIKDISVAMLVTVTPDGALRSRPMVTEQVSADGELWFFLSEDSEAAHDLAEEQGVNVSYAKPESDHYVSVTGQASLVKDRKKLQELWDTELTRYFPNGLEDPQLTLLCVRIETAEYWDAASINRATSRSPKKRETDQPHAHADGAGVEEQVEHTKVDIRATRASG